MTSFKLVGFILLVVCFGFIASIFISLKHRNNFKQIAISTTGEVIDVITRSSKDYDGNRTISRYPLIRYTDKNGSIIEFEGGSEYSIMIGEKVNVYYNPYDSKDAELEMSVNGWWWPGIILGFFATITGGLGFGFLWTAFKKSY